MNQKTFEQQFAEYDTIVGKIANASGEARELLLYILDYLTDEDPEDCFGSALAIYMAVSDRIDREAAAEGPKCFECGRPVTIEKVMGGLKEGYVCICGHGDVWDVCNTDVIEDGWVTF